LSNMIFLGFVFTGNGQFFVLARLSSYCAEA